MFNVIEFLKGENHFSRNVFFNDKTGNLLIGYNHVIEVADQSDIEIYFNLEITEAEADALLVKDILKSKEITDKILFDFSINDLSDFRKDILTILIFKLQEKEIRKMKKFLICLSEGKYDEATYELLNSKLFMQSARTCGLLSIMLERGHF
jgi:hypothetical protein